MMLNRYAQLFGGPDPRMGGSLGAPSMPQPTPGAANNGDLAQQWYRQHTGFLPGSPMADGVQPQTPQAMPPAMLASPGALAPPHAGMMPQGYDFGQRFGLMQQMIMDAQKAQQSAKAPQAFSGAPAMLGNGGATLGRGVTPSDGRGVAVRGSLRGY